MVGSEYMLRERQRNGRRRAPQSYVTAEGVTDKDRIALQAISCRGLVFRGFVAGGGAEGGSYGEPLGVASHASPECAALRSGDGSVAFAG